jgi:pimeloyl-ACP methyl ester carboxylesterase
MSDSFDMDLGNASSSSAGVDHPPIMLIHGMWSGGHVWDNFKGFLEARGHRVVAPTLRHHECDASMTPHPELGTTSVADYIDDLIAEIRALGERPVLIGHSMGGLLAQILAARGLAHGVIGLASAHCAGFVTFDFGPIWVFRKEVMRRRFWQKPQLPSFDTMRFGTLNGLPAQQQEELYARLVPESGRALFEIGYWFFDRRRTTWIDPASIDCPMLFMTGVNDRLTPLPFTQRMVQAHGSKARIEPLHGHAHWLPGEPGWESIALRCAHFVEHELRERATALASNVLTGIRTAPAT